MNQPHTTPTHAGRPEAIQKLHAAGYLAGNNTPTDAEILDAIDQAKAANTETQQYNRLYPRQTEPATATSDDAIYNRLFPQQQ